MSNAHRFPRLLPPVALATIAAALCAAAPPPARPGAATPADGADWRSAEAPFLSDHVQLTFPQRFIKAGEAYFSPDAKRIVFQGVEATDDETTPEDFYGMFVADAIWEGDRLVRLGEPKRVSPVGSANTCGWFHPTDPNRLIFGSTVVAPTESTPPGYQRGSGRYRWMFPPEMRIVEVDLRTADGSASSLKELVPHAGAYMAECALSPDGRHLVYCSLESNQGDLFIKDLRSGRIVRVVEKPGYDGGPFFSPDGRRICWRSDRRGDNLLQVFVADLRFDESGSVVGIGPERQLTNNRHVNWAPFWHPSGVLIAYATSEVGHRNYEVFLVDADPGDLPASEGPQRYGTDSRRVTFAEGADVLPVFSPDGRWMLWTSQRGADRSSQLWAARWVPAAAAR